MVKRIIALIFSILVILAVIWGVLYVVPEYMKLHEYYPKMMQMDIVWKVLIPNILISLLAAGLIAVIYNSSVSSKTRFWSIVFIIGFMLYMFGLVYINIKGASGSPTQSGLIGNGSLMWLINVIVMFGMMLLFISFLFTLGTYIKEKLLRLPTKDIFGVVTNFGLGLSVFLLVSYILILINLYFSLVSWILLAVAIFFVFWKKELLAKNWQIIDEKLSSALNMKKNPFVFPVILLLLAFSFMYFNFGFLMSWIPYPTAWDANHAYMFYPKMWALNHGFYWNEPNMNTTPYLWLAYITYWFSLFVPFYDKIWIAPDTWAVEMNFLSGVFVLVFGLALLWEMLNIVSSLIFKKQDNFEPNDIKQILFLFGWFLILLWLTSGMGAFLVFVDNKTDLGVLTLIILALYGGFLAFRKIVELGKDNSFSEIFPYLLLSAFFFAVAVASKPTAFFDVVNFAGFVSTYFLGIFVGIFIFVAAIFVLGYLQFRGITNYFTKELSINLFGKPAILSGVLGLAEVVYRKSWKYLRYLLIWGVAFVVFLVVIKGMWVVGERIFYPERFKSMKDIFMALFFG